MGYLSCIYLIYDYSSVVWCFLNRGVREADREGATDRLEVWKKYDELAFNVNMWMLKRNEQYIKQVPLHLSPSLPLLSSIISSPSFSSYLFIRGHISYNFFNYIYNEYIIIFRERLLSKIRYIFVRIYFL